MSYTLPYTFVPGTKARAQEVNANFTSLTDALEIIDSNKANLDLSNITPEALEVIKNNSSIRNIGELIFSPIPITDSNLHLLDGSLLNGNGIYGDFINYIKKQYNTDSAYNPDIFTVTGDLSITNNGIATGFSQNPNRNVKLNQGINTTNYTICGEFTTPATLDSSVPFCATCTIDGAVQLLFSLRFDPIQHNGYLICRNLNNTTTNILTRNNFIAEATSYKYKIIVDESNVTLKINDETIGSINNFCQIPVSYMVLGAERFNNEPFSGSIDLKEFSVSENGIVTLSGEKKCNYFTDEQTWQQSVSQYGECAKFVYNSTSNTVRLPKIRGLIEYTTATSELGDLTEAGLPNITGFVDEMCTYSSSSPTGAFYQTSSDTWRKSGTDQTLYQKDVHFDASRSSSIYGKSSTVQPQTVKYLVYIVVASTPKTTIQVNIDNIATDLNEKLDKDLSNIEVSNIRNFDGQWIYKDTIINNSNISAGKYDVDLSSYLPNDQNKYEVIVNIYALQNSSATNSFVILSSSIITEPAAAVSNANLVVNSNSPVAGFQTVFPVGSNKVLSYRLGGQNFVSLHMRLYGYRRIGTNN